MVVKTKKWRQFLDHSNLKIQRIEKFRNNLIVYLSIYSKLLNLLILLCSHITRITILRQNSQNLSLSQVTSLQSEDGKTAVGQQPLGLGDGGGRVDLLVVRQASSYQLCTEIMHHQIINSLVVNLRTGLTLLSSTRPATSENENERSRMTRSEIKTKSTLAFGQHPICCGGAQT